MSETPFTVRLATPNDLPVCAQIINDYIDQTEWLPRINSRQEIAALFAPAILQARYFIVAEQDKKIGGYLSLDEDEGMIPGLYTSPEYRGRGVGKALMDGAKKRHPRYLQLTVFEPNGRAKKFYEREGFSEVPEGRDDATKEGVPTLLMRWEGVAA